MDKKELNKYVNDYVKYINSNKELLGLSEDVVVSTKLSVEEMESHCEKIGEQISEALGSDVPEDFINVYTILGEKIEEYKESLKGDSASAEDKLKKAPVKAAVKTEAPKETPTELEKATAPPATEKKKRGPKKATTPKQKDVITGVKDKAIIKLFDLLPPEAIDSLDSGTMRTILLVQK